MMMSITADTVVARYGGEALSLERLLQTLHLEGRFLSASRRAITRQLIDQYADAYGLSVSDEQLQRVADQFRRRRGLLSSDDMCQWLSKQHFSVLDFQAILEHHLKSQLVFASVTSTAEGLFESNRFVWDKVHFQKIVFRSEHLADEFKCQHLDDGIEVAQLLDQLTGAGFEQETFQIHTCFRGSLPTWVKESIAQACSGSLVGPLTCPSGWALIYVEKVIPAAFDRETESAVRKHLFQRWLSARIQESKISYPLLDLLSCSNDS